MVGHCICFVKEKDLIHKLFKVLVPRYQNYEASFTQIWNLPIQYPGKPIPRAILELKGKIQIYKYTVVNKKEPTCVTSSKINFTVRFWNE